MPVIFIVAPVVIRVPERFHGFSATSRNYYIRVVCRSYIRKVSP
jgi:hypothetical protein